MSTASQNPNTQNADTLDADTHIAPPPKQDSRRHAEPAQAAGPRFAIAQLSLAHRLALVGIASLLVAVVAWGIAPTAANTAEHRERIAAMTAAERQQLRQAAERFASLPADERAAILNLHAAVQADPALLQTLQDYELFLDAGIQPWDRQELWTIDDPTRRVERVFALDAQQRTARETATAGQRGETAPLPPETLDTLFTLAAESLHLPADQFQHLNTLDPPQRHLEIAQQVVKETEPRPYGNPWPSSRTIETMVAALPAGPDTTRLRDAPPDFQRLGIAATLVRGLVAEWQQIATTTIPEADIRTAMNALPADERARLARRGGNELTQHAMVTMLPDRAGPIGAAASGLKESLALRDRVFDRFRDRFRRGDRGDRGDHRSGDRRPGFDDRDHRRGPPPPPPRGDEDR